MRFDLYPAIDLYNGHCVRLVQGDYDREIRYDINPVAVAKEFAAAGATWIHVVDLDAARTGVINPINRSIISQICDTVNIPVQCSGGIRSLEAITILLDAGASRCVLGTAIIEQPELISQAIDVGHRMAIGLDVRGREIAIRGWGTKSGISISDVLPTLTNPGIEAVIITQIERDGTGKGADLEILSEALALTNMDVIASGGIGTIRHIQQLAALSVAGHQLAGVICGKALHDNSISINNALVATQRPEIHSVTASDTLKTRPLSTSGKE